VAKIFLHKGTLRPVAPADTGYSSTFAAVTRKKPEPDRKTHELIACLTEAHDMDLVKDHP